MISIWRFQLNPLNLSKKSPHHTVASLNALKIFRSNPQKFICQALCQPFRILFTYYLRKVETVLILIVQLKSLNAIYVNPSVFCFHLLSQESKNDSYFDCPIELSLLSKKIELSLNVIYYLGKWRRFLILIAKSKKSTCSILFKSPINQGGESSIYQLLLILLPKQKKGLRDL